jgi:predicted phosphohydrolase
MKLIYFSDLHLEFIKPTEIDEFITNIPPGLEEICILAGDIGNPYQSTYNTFMEYISKNFRKSFVISGNHEYYNKSKTVEETNNFMKEYFEKFHNITFLDNAYEIYENHCFIGSTLWSKITNPLYEISDVIKIPNFNYIEYNRLNMLAVDFVKDALQNNENCVVITHHVPSKTLIDVKYKTQKLLPYNQWFYCNMEEIFETNGNKIKCWIYGHTHTPSTMTINGIPFLCNPAGYPNENKKIDFQSNITLY